MEDKDLPLKLNEAQPLTRPEDLSEEDKKLVEELKNIQIKEIPSTKLLNTIKNRLLENKNKLEKRRAKAKRAKMSRKRNRG
jgi:hypothetical protein